MNNQTDATKRVQEPTNEAMIVTKELKTLTDNVENDMESQYHIIKFDVVSLAPTVGHFEKETKEGKASKILSMGSLNKIQEAQEKKKRII